MTQQAAHRIAGFDCFRSMATFFVVFTHLAPVLQKRFPVLNAFNLPDGVTLFFVLSGCLIGEMLLSDLTRYPDFGPAHIFRFLKRRWWRTLPNYYLFLLVNVALIGFHLIPGTLNKYLLSFVFFCQNLIIPFDFLYWESWSLSVEEWFYGLFPVLVFVFLLLNRRKPYRAYLITCALFILSPVIVRYFSEQPWHTYPLWDVWYRKRVITQLDAPGYGMLMAFLIYRFPEYMKKWKQVLFVIGCGGVLYFTFFPYSQHIFVYKTVYTALLAFFCMLMMPACFFLKRLAVGGAMVEWVAKLSYANYLIHLPVILILMPYWPVQSFAGFWGFLCLFIAIIGSFSYLVYRYFEKPFMDRRDHR